MCIKFQSQTKPKTMPKVEVIFKIKAKSPIYEIVQNNLELFHKLDLKGVKSISTAIDHLTIYNTYKQYDWIENAKERKETVASQLKVTKKTVENALNLMNEIIEIKI